MQISTHSKDRALIIITLLLVAVAAYSIRSYLAALFCGALIAYFLHKPYEKLSQRVKSHTVAAVILSVAATAVFIGALAFIIPDIVQQSQTAYNLIHTHLPKLLELCGDWCDSDLLTKEQLISSAKASTAQLTTAAKTILERAGSLITFITITLFAVFYFFEYGAYLARTAFALLPLKTEHTARIQKRLEDSINAVVLGNIGSAILQGTAGGLLFFLFGIPSPTFWGFLMTITAFIPGIGHAVIWVPASIVLFMLGEPHKAIILAVLCLLSLGYIDNFVKPRIIGNKLQLSSFMVFLAVLGGLTTFGLLGIFIGPILFAVAATSLELYQNNTK